MRSAALGAGLLVVALAYGAWGQGASPQSLSDCLQAIPGMRDLLAAPATGSAAGGESCDPQHRLCCSWWEVDSTEPGETPLTHIEDSFDKLQRTLEQARKTDDFLCHGGFKSDCNVQYGAPHCAQGFGAPAQPDLSTLAGQLESLDQRMTAALHRVQEAKSRWDALSSGTTGFVQPDGGNPFAGIGGETAEYGNNLQGELSKLQAMRSCMSTLSTSVASSSSSSSAYNPYYVDGPQWNPYVGSYGLWTVDGQFGGHEDATRIHDAVAALTSGWQAQIDRANAIKDPAALELEAAGTVAQQWGGRFAVVIGGVGALRRGQRVPARTYPMVCVAPGATPVFAEATVEVAHEPLRTRLTVSCDGARAIVIDEPKPDRDHDGIPDDDDDCPDQRGIARWHGCPTAPDRDHDGIADADDACPDEPGPRSRKGCPPHSCPRLVPNVYVAKGSTDADYKLCTFEQIVELTQPDPPIPGLDPSLNEGNREHDLGAFIHDAMCRKGGPACQQCWDQFACFTNNARGGLYRTDPDASCSCGVGEACVRALWQCVRDLR